MIQKLFYFLLFFLLTFGASAQLKPVDKQYIKDAPWNKNPGFEQGKSNYSLYKDADQAIPENMTGGTSDLKIALNSTNPIDGNRDLIITKDGSASRRGNGLSLPVTIPAGMQGQMVEICFQYRTSSGYLDDQVIVYAYDVTNASLASTEPAPMQLKAYAASTGSATHCAYVQAVSNSTSYRVGLHVSGTSDVDYTITIDNWWVGKVSTTNGAVVTAWESYTPTVTYISGGATNVTHTCKKRRNGDMLDVECRSLFSNTSAPFNTPVYSLPSGLVIDTAKTIGASNQHIGYSTCVNSANNTYTGDVQFVSTSTVSVNYHVTSGSASGTMGAITEAAPFTFDANDWIQVNFSVPIVGWQATGILGTDATTQVISAKYYLSGAKTIPNNTVTILDYAIKSKDTAGRVTTGAAWKFVADITGDYLVSASAVLDDTTHFDGAGENIFLTVYKNGAAFAALSDRRPYLNENYPKLSGFALVPMSAGDYIDIRIYQASGVDLNTTTGTDTNFVDIIRMSGPANAVALESDFKIPVGTVNEYVGTTAPTGWLLADGTSYERTGIYARLYGVIGTKYGAADSTHFNVPDMRGKFARGYDGGAANDPDRASRAACKTGGNTADNVGSCQGHAFQTHTPIQNAHYHRPYSSTTIHSFPFVTSASNLYTGAYGDGASVDNAPNTSSTTATNQAISPSGGTSQASTNETRPINVSFNYIIKY